MSFRKVVEREEGGPDRKDSSRIPIWNSVYASWIFTLFLQFLNLQESPCLGSQLWQVIQGETLQPREGRETESSFPDGSQVRLVTLLWAAGSSTFPNSSLSLLHARLGRNRTASGRGSTSDASSGLYLLDTKLTSTLVSQMHECFQPARWGPPHVVPNSFFLSLELSGVQLSISRKKRSWAFYFAEEEVSGLAFPLQVKRPWPWFIVSSCFFNHTQHTVNTWKVDLGIPPPLR